MTLGLVWTPCAGPVLGSILTLIATEPQRGYASLLLLAYAVGAAVPMIAIAYGGDFIVSRVRAAARVAPWLQRGFGGLVVASALLMLFQYDTLVVSWLSHFYPAGQAGL
jgi:cytochrome c biogenesis protein CcdA